MAPRGNGGLCEGMKNVGYIYINIFLINKFFIEWLTLKQNWLQLILVIKTYEKKVTIWNVEICIIAQSKGSR